MVERQFDFSGFCETCGIVRVTPPGHAVYIAIYKHDLIMRQAAHSIVHVEQNEYDPLPRPYYTIHASPSGCTGTPLVANFAVAPNHQDIALMALRCLIYTEEHDAQQAIANQAE